MKFSATMVTAFCVVVALGCEDDRGSPLSGRSDGLHPAGACKDVEIADLIPQIYSQNKHQSEAAGFCKDVISLVDDGEGLAAIATAYQWLERTYDLGRAGLLAPIVGKDDTTADKIQELFEHEVFGENSTFPGTQDALLTQALQQTGLEPPNLSNLAEGLEAIPDFNGIVVDQVVGPCGGGSNDPCIVVTPNKHAAVQLQNVQQTDGPFVVISTLPPTQTFFGECIAVGDDKSHDCFNDQLFVAVFSPDGTPAVNSTNTAIGGLCVDDFYTYAPDNPPTFGDEGTPSTLPAENNLGITQGKVDNSGNLIFLTDATLPAGVLNCSTSIGNQASGFRGTLWAALGPAQHLFRVTPAYAAPGPMGAAFSNFSPVVAADRRVRNGTLWGTAFSVFDEVSGADVTVYECPDDPVSAADCIAPGNEATTVDGDTATAVTQSDGSFVVGGLPIDGVDGTTYAITVVRNKNLQGVAVVADDHTQDTMTLTPEVRDVETVVELFPPGQS